MKSHTITISDRGRFTLPTEVRRKLGVGEGGLLRIHFDDLKGELVVSKMANDDAGELNSENGNSEALR